MSGQTPAHTFVNGTPADAEEVNDLFEDIYDRFCTVSGDTFTGTMNVRSLIPTAANTYDLGSSGNPFRTIYVTTGISGAGAPSSFKTIAVSGQDDVVADSSTDTLTLVGAGQVTITTDDTSDTITITASNPTPTLAAWNARTENTAYQAATIGFFVAVTDGSAGVGSVAIVSDANASPSTLRAKYSVSNSFDSAMIPVRAADYYKGTTTTDSGTVTTTFYFVPLTLV